MRTPGRRSLLLAAFAVLAAPAVIEAQSPRGRVLEITEADATTEIVTGAAAAANGDFVLAWTVQPPAGPSRVRLRLFRADGTPRTPELAVGSPPWPQFGPRVAMRGDGRFVVVWTENVPGHTRVLGRRFGAAGTPLGAPFRLTPTLVGNQGNPDVAVAPDGSFVAVWESDHVAALRRDAPDIFARRYGADGRPRGPEFQVNTETVVDQIEPRVEVGADGRFVVVWMSWGGEGSFWDVKFQRFAASGARRGDETAMDTGLTFVAGQVNPALAMAPDGGFEVVCSDLGGDSQRTDDHGASTVGIRGQRYAANGAPIGEAAHLNAVATGFQSVPDVARRVGGFFAVWESFSGTENVGVFGRRLAEDGTPVGPDLLISAPEPIHRFPVLALNAAGRGIAAWNEYDPDLRAFRVLARRIVQAPAG